MELCSFFIFIFYICVTWLDDIFSLFPGTARHIPDTNHLPEGKPHQKWRLKGRAPWIMEVELASSHLWEMNDLFLLTMDWCITQLNWGGGEVLTENHFQASAQFNCLHIGISCHLDALQSLTHLPRFKTCGSPKSLKQQLDPNRML